MKRRKGATREDGEMNVLLRDRARLAHEISFGAYLALDSHVALIEGRVPSSLLV